MGLSKQIGAARHIAQMNAACALDIGSKSCGITTVPFFSLQKNGEKKSSF
jgi:hypothetical protein